MLSISAFIASGLALASVAHGAPEFASIRSDQPDVSSYATVPITWELPVKADDPAGATVEVTGTIEEAIAQMDATYPGWNETFQAHLPPPPTVDSGAFDLAALDDPESYICKLDQWKEAGQLSILRGIEYLRGLTGSAKNGPGPGECGRVSCSWQSAIWWCNDNDTEKEVGWNDIADGTLYILQKCSRDAQYVKGQAFYKDKWNVIVRYDNDSC
ncbi:hypothetical protein QC761_506430 [Podospora bellae-mahoneyi]|uniref:Uncharacterized protein n=1 Tax=Podospora bellae-mahoneyi TaxID=2093777 RepID=A0ABR0FHP8_9PEZI|nr:hypothetical protein QC761_506430 [Podospora bellae-mahoneyi]